MVEFKSSHPAFDQMKITPTFIEVTILSSMGVFMDGFSLSIFSAALTYLQAYILVRAIYVSLAASAIYIGMFLGSFSMGHLSDRIGRKRMYTYDLAITSLFLILTALSTTFYEFFIFELLAGIGIGADYPLSSSIEAEFSPRRSRGRFLVFNIFMWTIGSIVFYVISIPLIYRFGSTSWRWMYAVGAIVPIIVILARRALPESPYWLVKAGREDEAKKIADDIGKEVGYTDVELPMVEKGSSSYKSVFTGSYLPLIIFASLAWFSYDVSSYGVWNYTPSIFVSVGVSAINSILSTLLEDLPVIVGFVICLILIERVGRKLLQSVGFGLAGVSLLTFALYADHRTMPFIMIFTAFALMHLFHNIGPTNLTYVYPVEIFPTRIRGTAMGIATAASRIGAILGVFAFPLITDSVGMSSGLLFFAIFEFVGFIVTVTLAPETKAKPIS
ncbi:MFS transporter [Thermoplasma sp. Kam2015]|uniref:MFS transporter n=1 Tax=Thermoplasma sp. Kam2015 TaxID=2094122 RepID=UPI000D9B983A|nr:MFS transporter [Thermoplasma sp. Kam2015]PYB68724.1 MFS transporter [Thermoplasma sp. Kam2015]